MMTLKYCKSMNEIVLLVDNKCISLKQDLKEIEMPTDLIKAIPFVKKTLWSNFVEMPYGEDSNFTKEYLSEKNESFPRVLEFIEPRLAINYAYNEVNEPFFQLGGKFPKYVLNGIAKFIDDKYWKNNNF